MVGLVAEVVGVDAPVAGVLESALALGFAASGRRVVTPAVVVLRLGFYTIVSLGSLRGLPTRLFLALVIARVAVTDGDAPICVFRDPGPIRGRGPGVSACLARLPVYPSAPDTVGHYLLDLRVGSRRSHLSSVCRVG